MARSWKQWWCGIRIHTRLHRRIVDGCVEDFCPRCGQVLLRLRLPER